MSTIHTFPGDGAPPLLPDRAAVRAQAEADIRAALGHGPRFAQGVLDAKDARVLAAAGLPAERRDAYLAMYGEEIEALGNEARVGGTDALARRLGGLAPVDWLSIPVPPAPPIFEPIERPPGRSAGRAGVVFALLALLGLLVVLVSAH